MTEPIYPTPPSAMEQTRLQAFKELRSLLSDVLASAVADEEVPEAFKSANNWEKLISQTESRLAEGWKQRFQAGIERRENPRTILDLLPDDEHEQQLLSERFVNEVSWQDREPLDELDRQLAALSGDEFDERRANPLGPSAWVEGLRGGMKLIHCTPEERDWLLERLIPLLTARMSTFYSGLSARLSSSGVVGRPGHSRGTGSTDRAGSSSSQEFRPDLVETRTDRLLATTENTEHLLPASEGSDPLEQLFGLLSARRAGADPGYSHEAAPGYGYMPAMPGMAMGSMLPGPMVPAGTPMMPGSMIPVPPGMVPVFPGGQGETYPGGWTASDQAIADGSAQAAAPAMPWTQADVMSILAMLQNSYQPSPGAASIGRLGEAVASTASQMGLAGGITQMPGQSQDMLELVSMLFEALLDGRRLDEKARAQLSRLIIPYVRAAMLDRRLFMQSSHPARRVLNLLVEALEIAAPDVPHYRPLRELAFKVADRVVEEFADDLRLFDRLEELLASEIESSRRRAELAERRAATALAGKEKREAARESVATFLGQALAGKTLPQPLLAFLAGPWQHHQTVVLLREGEAGPGVMANRLLLRDLLRCTASGAIDEGIGLRQRVDEVLASSGEAGAAADEFVAALAQAFEHASAASEKETVQTPAASDPVAAIVAALAAAPAPASDSDSREDVYLLPSAPEASAPLDIVERYARSPIGTWLDFVGEDGRVTSARISWTSPISGRRILSNRRGQRMLVASPQELAEMELEGRIRPRQSESAFDQAMVAVADRLEKATVATATATG